MTVSIIITILVCTMFSQQIHSRTDGWRGIVPLHSTRQDVERLLGSAHDETKSFYKTDRENITIRYSQGPCIGSTAWNVPVDTVLYITIYPQPYGRMRLIDLNIDRDKFKKEDDQELPNTYNLINEVEGITVYVSKDNVTGEDRVTGFNYKHAAKDKHLRCKL